MGPLGLHHEPFGIDIVLLLALFLHLFHISSDIPNFFELLNTLDLFDTGIQPSNILLCLVEFPLFNQHKILFHDLHCLNTQEVLHHLRIRIELVDFLVTVHESHLQFVADSEGGFAAQRFKKGTRFHKGLIAFQIINSSRCGWHQYLQDEVLADA